MNINVDGFQCFYGILITILKRNNNLRSDLILNYHMWNYGFTYDFYDLQNSIVDTFNNCGNEDPSFQNQIEKKHGVKLEFVSNNDIKEVNFNLEYGKPIFVINKKKEVFVIVDYIRDTYALKNIDGVVFVKKDELAECQLWKIRDINLECRLKLKCELRITENRYSLIRAAQEEYGLHLEYVSSIESLYEILQSGKKVIAQCNMAKLPYKSEKHNKEIRYILLDGIENQAVRLIDVIDRKEIRIDFSYLKEELLDNEKILYACLWDEQYINNKNIMFSEEASIKLYVQEKAEEICRNTEVFYEQLYYYIKDIVLNDSNQLQKKLDYIYYQLGDIEKVRALFIDAMNLVFSSYNKKIQEIYEKVKEKWCLLKTLQVRVMFLKNEIILGKLHDCMEEIVENEKRLICMLKNDWKKDLALKKNYRAKLGEFEIFKDLWYRDCVYHGIFTAMSYYNKPIFPFLSQNIYIYDMNSSNGLVEMKKPINDDMQQILHSMGILVSYKSVEKNIVNDVIYNIDHNRIVIVSIDKYYEEICPDTYKKVHQRHELMIYGYDFMEQKVYVVENKFINSSLFGKKCISFEGLYRAHLGYRQRYYDDVKKDYLCLENTSDFIADLNVIKEKYVKNIKHFMVDRKKSIHCIEKLIQLLYLENQQIDSIQWINMCNDIITNKKIEAFSCKKLGIDYNYELKEAIIRMWDLIRINLIKLERTRNRDDIITNIERYLQGIVNMEHLEICNFLAD